MRFFWQFLAVLALALTVCGAARADITHRVSFSVGPQILVWTADGQVHQGESVSLTAEGETAALLHSSEMPVLTGRLLQASAVEARPVTLRLRVATNTPFTISATSPGGTAWDASTRLVSVGPNASASGAMPRINVTVSGDAPAKIFNATERTAASPGSAQTQSLLIDILMTPGQTGGEGGLPTLSFSPLP